MVPVQFIEQLIKLGTLLDAEKPEKAIHFKNLKTYEKYMVGTWQDWYPICESLSINDHIALFKALVLAEKHAQIGGADSGSSGVWVYRKLDKRLTYSESLKIALWTIQNSNNSYLPFGNIPDRIFFEDNTEKFQRESKQSLVAQIRLERSLIKTALLKHEAQIKDEKLQQKRIRAKAHQERQNGRIAYIGIDCATKNSRIGLALGELSGKKLIITKCCKASDRTPACQTVFDWLCGYERAILAFDAPLGWAYPLGQSLANHKAGELMGANSDVLFRRITDIDIKNRLGKRPLEVGANLISRTSVSALELLQRIRERTGRKIPLAWEPFETEAFRAIEVYPAATRIAYGAKDKGGSLKGLEEHLDTSSISLETLMSTDAVDAIVCALAAADFFRKKAVPPSRKTHEVFVEGWIWAPNRDVSVDSP